MPKKKNLKFGFLEVCPMVKIRMLLMYMSVFLSIRTEMDNLGVSLFLGIRILERELNGILKAYIKMI